jgi:hypothetical protein
MIVRRAIESLYLDTCDIYEYQKVVNDDFSTNVELVLVHEQIPCKLSYRDMNQTYDVHTPTIKLIAKLIINPDIEVKAGSRIVVTRKGVQTAYKNSGKSARYFNHQEIMLELEEETA